MSAKCEFHLQRAYLRLFVKYSIVTGRRSGALRLCDSLFGTVLPNVFDWVVGGIEVESKESVEARVRWQFEPDFVGAVAVT
jgi:hypothetical protein